MTRNAGFTPGPWQAVPLAAGQMWGVVSDMGGPGKTFLTVAMLDYVDPATAANESNARLISAAPDLLDALKRLLRDLKKADV